jgi:hypothetical protein
MRNNQSQHIETENIWFWFVSAKKVQNGFKNRSESGGVNRNYELADIEMVILRLQKTRKLSVKEIQTIVRFGMLRRVPNKNLRWEYNDAICWESAIETLSAEFLRKGWVL